MNIFPYKPRRYQQEIMDTIAACLERGEHFIMEAPAGSGKTIASLTSCLSFAAEHNMGVLYLTRTNSQQKQAIWELKKIAEHLGIRAVSIQGRMNMCLLVDSLAHLRERNISNEEIARLCAVRKKRSLSALKGEDVPNRCVFFEHFLYIIRHSERSIFFIVCCFLSIAGNVHKRIYAHNISSTESCRFGQRLLFGRKTCCFI